MRPQFCIGTIQNPTDSDSHAWHGEWSVNCVNLWKATLGQKLTLENAILIHNVLVIHEISHILSGEDYCWTKIDVKMSFWDELHKIIHKVIRASDKHKINCSFVGKVHGLIHLLSEEIYRWNGNYVKLVLWDEFIKTVVD